MSRMFGEKKIEKSYEVLSYCPFLKHLKICNISESRGLKLLSADKSTAGLVI